ncbi:hypothetical protein DERP_004917 [Dermatophagoides pteronyssinus]|uniref:Uncharacterized protein n=1 Tax=Dermatophagoides pteronyssinus TaxID=6956 RepID=A0ABQ8JTC5_DERPT|nr:hypothetical protein DERP_004917 [Dermatophagoides pteronyssinus]
MLTPPTSRHKSTGSEHDNAVEMFRECLLALIVARIRLRTITAIPSFDDTNDVIQEQKQKDCFDHG